MNEPIRILHVVTYMGMGGIETMLMNFYRNIDRSKVQFDFLTHREERAAYDDEIESLGGKIYRLPVLNPFSKNYRKALSNFFDEHPEYKVVHVHQDCLSGIILKEAYKHRLKIRIAHSHNSSQIKDLKYIVKMIYKPLITKYATKLFACSVDAGKFMFGENADFEVFNNAIDAQKYIFSNETRDKIRKELGISEDELVIGHVGSIYYPKNHPFLLGVFKEISSKCKARLLLVGDGPDRENIEKLAIELNIADKIIFTGIRKDVYNVLQAMDVFVFPSHYEGLPVTTIEAQASGLPCLISDGVPIECKKTDLVYQLKLTDDIKLWADKAIELSKTERKNTYDDIVRAGYDIKTASQALTKYYIDIYNK